MTTRYVGTLIKRYEHTLRKLLPPEFVTITNASICCLEGDGPPITRRSMVFIARKVGTLYESALRILEVVFLEKCGPKNLKPLHSQNLYIDTDSLKSAQARI